MPAPTRALGSTDPYAYSNSLPYDVLEHIPDLQPGFLAVQTYAQMRRDSRLAAVLAGYSLQIRRASWQVEPGGCRPEVVQQVADDMGLPVAGKDKPGAARTRGVSWNDHLRLSLLCLPFGHMCFELLAEVVDGRARLTALAERMPFTLEQVHSDPETGALLGVTQDKMRSGGAPQIPADRLAYYTHNREASWAGTSLLRPSFAPWYLKRELMAVHATSARRFGMGVPTVEWAMGSNPTPQQISQAQQLASAARVGETAGAALPPGASLVLRGLSGGTPDVLGYIKFLNQEMAGAALMPHLDLGTSETGSRAVASTFLDSWTLALGAIAEEIADVATRQIAARIVRWNWGEDEQVPRIVVSGVGTQREATAESLQALLAAGALSSDPALEAWVRREYRLPERAEDKGPSRRPYEYDLQYGVLTRNELRANLGLPALAGPEGDLPPMPIAGDSGKPLSGAGREVAAAAADEGAQQEAWRAATAALVAAWPVLSQPLVDAITAQVAAADVAALADLSAPQNVLDGIAAAVERAMADVALNAAVAEVAAARLQGVTIDAPTPDGSRLADVAKVTAALIAVAYIAAATRRALQVGPAAAADAVREVLTAMGTATSGVFVNHAGAAMSAAQNAGRTAVFEAHPPKGFVADEHADDLSKCQPCKDIDGTVFPNLASALAAYPTAGYVGCLGRGQCRGRIRAVWS